MTREQAIKKLEQMSLTDCIDLWNEKACNHYCRFEAIHKMSEEEWWNALSKHLGTLELVLAVKSAGECFSEDDEYLLLDVDGRLLRSFSTKNGLIGIIGLDWFIDELKRMPMMVDEHGRAWEVLGVVPSLADALVVGDFEGLGTIYMNNAEGYIILWEDSGRVLKSNI